jgi:protein TonB
VIEYPDIVQSTGDPDMDKLMLRQIASVQPPQATGLRADEIHEFIKELDMPTPFESFQSGIYGAIDAKKIYPKEAVMGGVGGVAAVDFDYLDGKISGITLVRASRDKDLDKVSVGAVTRAVMPPVPPAYAGQARHMEAIFCYSLRESAEAKNPCPAALNVIEVTGTRIRRGSF